MKNLKVSLSSGVELIVNEVSDTDAKEILNTITNIANNLEESKKAKVFIHIKYKMGDLCLNVFDVSAISFTGVPMGSEQGIPINESQYV